MHPLRLRCGGDSVPRHRCGRPRSTFDAAADASSSWPRTVDHVQERLAAKGGVRPAWRRSMLTSTCRSTPRPL